MHAATRVRFIERHTHGIGVVDALHGGHAGQIGHAAYGIAGIVCGYIGRNQARERGLPTSMATAGLICAIIGTVLGILFAILVGAIIISSGS